MSRPSNLATVCTGMPACRAAQLWTAGLVFCLSENWISGEYPLPYGDRYVCLHPQNTESAGRYVAEPHGAG